MSTRLQVSGSKTNDSVNSFSTFGRLSTPDFESYLWQHCLLNEYSETGHTECQVKVNSDSLSQQLFSPEPVSPVQRG